MKEVIRTRREWLQAAAMGFAGPCLWAARKEFWETKDPATWSNEEKEALLGHSPWARDGFARMEEKRQPTVGYARMGSGASTCPIPSPGLPPGGLKSVPIGETIPPRPPKPGSGQPLQFRVLARWETAKPVRLAGGPEVPEMTGQFYVIRLRGLPLMPPPKPKAGEPAPPDPNEGMLAGDQSREAGWSARANPRSRARTSSRDRGMPRPRCCSFSRAEQTRLHSPISSSRWRAGSPYFTCRSSSH